MHCHVFMNHSVERANENVCVQHFLDESRILFHAVEHVTTARDQTSHEHLDFKQVADSANQPSDNDSISFPVRGCGAGSRARCATGHVACRRPFPASLLIISHSSQYHSPLLHTVRATHEARLLCVNDLKERLVENNEQRTQLKATT